jgi:C1A family cysteine protease
MPYSSSNGCSLLPTFTQNTEAANYKIPVFSRIYNYDQAAIKNMIYTKHPVLTGVSIDANFRNAYPGYIWNSYSGFSGDHGVVICGYDDAKHAYLAINSWGTNWGDAGYVWIDYDFFPTISSYYLYVMR